MATTPVDDHTQEFEELAGLSALDVLEGDELARFERHAAGCERCRLMVRLDREALALAAPEMDPSPDFKQRLLRRAADEVAQAQPPKVIPIWRRARWASALAAIFVVALVSAGAYTYQNQVIASYALTGTLSGSAVVKIRRSGAAELELSGLEAPPPGLLHEAWIIPPGGQPIPAGVTDRGDAQLPLTGLTNGATVAITEERTRVERPTSQPVMATEVRL